MLLEKRSLAGSDAYFTVTNKTVWSVWDIDRAVSQGYQANPWVFRAIQIIVQQAASVPWVVFDEKMSPIWDHPLSKLFARPNDVYPAQRMMELIVQWLELGGNAYLKKVKVGANTKEVWPVSPDRIGPIPSRDPALFIDGYRVKKDGGREEADPEYNKDTVIHFGFTNPANPYLGISPLGAAAKATDLDNSQMEWNASTMQNRGVVDGMFSFKRTLEAPQAQSVADRIREKFSGKKNARKPLVVGEDAQYTKLSLTPVEMDFLKSRNNNRDEILAVFGVPPQLAGAQEASTYNNYSSSLRILWKSTIIPTLDLIKSSLNHSFADELTPGLTLGYDTSEVSALQENEAERFGTAKIMYSMGVPVSIINERLGLAIPSYPGWEKPRAVSDTPPKEEPPPGNGSRSFELVPLEQRSVDSDIKLRDQLAEGDVLTNVQQALFDQRDAVMTAIAKGDDATAAAKTANNEWTRVLSESYERVALALAARVVVPRGTSRSNVELRDNVKYTEELLTAIRAALQREGVVLTDLAHIQNNLVEVILQQTEWVLSNGLPYTALAQALTDTGVFSPERALRIARTTAGTAASIGQLEAGRSSGATHKKWSTSVADTRDAHTARDGEVVPVNERFSVQLGSVGPRYPLDPEVTAGDRINCRCFMSFSFVKEPAAKG